MKLQKRKKIKVLEYSWEDDGILGTYVKIQCVCGHIFTEHYLYPNEIVHCPSCHRTFKYLGVHKEFIFKPLGVNYETHESSS